MSILPNRFLRYGDDAVNKEDCSYIWEVAAQNRCVWAQNTTDCITDSLFQYTVFLFCNFDTRNLFLFTCGILLMLLLLLYMFLILGTTADQFFCPSLAVIADVLQLSDNIAGVTILAFGNGAPDIFTSLVSGSEEGIIMFTELIGAGIFVTTMIAGSVAFVKPFRTNLKTLMRDTFFYTMSICWISYVVYDEKVHLWEALSFVLCYVLFIMTVVLMQMQETRAENRKNIAIAAERAGNKDVFGNIPEETHHIHHASRPKDLCGEFLYDINPIGKDDWAGANRLLKFILIVRSPVMFLLQLFIPLVDMTVTKKGWSKLLNCFQLCTTPIMALLLLDVYDASIGPVPILPIFLVVGIVIGGIVFQFTRIDRAPKFHDAFAFIGFFTAMLSVYLIAGEVMAILQCVGHAFCISDAMLGITFLAWGNSVGDMISNVAIARQGFPRMGYAACFGGPMFNTLLGFGLTYGIAAGTNERGYTNIRMSDMAPGCLAFLLCALIATIFYMNITGTVARRSYAYLLFSIYFAFILIQFLSEFELMAPLGTDHLPADA